MHCEFPGYLGILVQTVSRFCVPFFFMVSGYYSFCSDGIKKPMSKKLKHILRITLGATLFYGVVTLIYHLFGITEYYSYITSIKTLIINWGIFNCPPIGSGQMWFLWALLYVYIIWSIIRMLKIEDAIIKFLPLLIAAYIFLAQGMHLCGIHIPNMIYRNVFIEGLAFFMLGYSIHKYQDKINISNNALFAILIISTALCPVERLIMGRDFGVNICSFPQVVALYLLAVKNPNYNANWTSPFRFLGKNCSMMIYILHPFVWHLTEQAYSAIGIAENVPALYVMPISVVMTTAIMSVLYFYINSKKVYVRQS